MINNEQLQQKAAKAVNHANSAVPFQSRNDAPYYTTQDKWEDARDNFIAGYEAGYQDRAGEGWISVKDRLPEAVIECLFVHTNLVDPLTYGEFVGNIHFGWHDGKVFRSYVEPSDSWNPTHWMPLPPKPQTEHE